VVILRPDAREPAARWIASSKCWARKVRIEITVLCLIAAQPGVDFVVAASSPRAHRRAALDAELNDVGYITPASVSGRPIIWTTGALTRGDVLVPQLGMLKYEV